MGLTMKEVIVMRMKRLLVILLAVFSLVSFVSCNGGKNAVQKNPDRWIDLSFSETPYGNVNEGEPLTEETLKEIVSVVPSEQYESYPCLHTVPLSATLYKNGKKASLDVTDSRLIGLINFYHNSIYHHKYAYTQGLLNIDTLEETVLHESFRLVLTFETKETSYFPYDTNVLRYDTLVVTNRDFTLIAYDIPGYEGEEDQYPYKAVGHKPLFLSYPWLDLFGF